MQLLSAKKKEYKDKKIKKKELYFKTGRRL